MRSSDVAMIRSNCDKWAWMEIPMGSVSQRAIEHLNINKSRDFRREPQLTQASSAGLHIVQQGRRGPPALLAHALRVRS